MTNRTPLITAIVLLLLPVLYVGSYLALVRPADYDTVEIRDGRAYVHGYRYFGDGFSMSWLPEVAPIVFWPLEQIDRKVRPGAWE